jgi:hypothetical protein
MPPWCLRLWCRLFGHRLIVERRARPVIPLFWTCRRCGKFGRVWELKR